ncbi:unnamed protein product [Rhizoctonia solani]|uniref:Zn(2)-C6 fungal-type domain-containing protein n=1 Tax=Rhizoctonia solani TaxID=456999 RepID=A0A8H3A6E6_9AGAM|nr:unnamed protein product [Rhizoctonia solani]
MSPSLTTHDTRRRDALSIDALVERPNTRQCGKCQEAQSRCDGREPCRNCEVRGTLCGYAWSSFSSPHTLPPIHQAPPVPQGHPVLYFSPPSAKRRSPAPTGSIFPRSNALDGGWAIVPQGTNAPAAPHPPGPVVACKTCQARNTPCDGVTPMCGSCRMRRLECYLATPASSSSDRRNGNGATMTWSARDRQALNPRSFPPSLSQAAMLLPPAGGPSRSRAPSDANKSSSSRASLSFMLNPNTEGKVASGSKGNGQRPSELNNISTSVKAPTHHVTPPTPVAPASMEKAQGVPPTQMDIDTPAPTSRDPPTSPSSSTSGTMGGSINLSRRPSRKRSASPEHYGPERGDSPGRESVSSLGVSALSMNGRRTRALSHIHSPRGSTESYSGRHVLEPHSPRSHSARGSVDSHHRGSMESHTRTSLDNAQSPTRSQSHSTRNSVDLHSRGQPLDEARNSHPEHLHSNRPIDCHPGRLADPHPIDAHAAHRRSSDQTQGLASPVDLSRPRSRSKSSLSHLLDGGGFGGMGSSPSPTRTTPPHTQAPPHAYIPDSTSPRTHARPPRTPSSEFGPGPSPTATSTSPSEPFSRPMSTESLGRPISQDQGFHRETGVAYRDPAHREPVPPAHRESGPLAHREPGPPVHRDPAPPHREPPKQASISTALADMQLKSAGTSRASSPGHGRHDVFVHSAFNGPNSGRHAWTTFGTAGESMANSEGRTAPVAETRAPAVSEGRMANVWRHETEAGMRRREAEAELRKQESHSQVDLHRRRSEGAKRRKIGESEDEHRAERDREMSVATDERGMSIVEPERRSSGTESDRRMSISESERRMSIVEADKHPIPEPEKRTSMAEPEKRMTGVETERKNSIPESGRRMSIVEHVRRATGVAPKDSGYRGTSNSLPNPRGNTTIDVFARSRRGSVPMPGAWTDDPKSQSVIVISDSPEAQTGDTEMEMQEQSEPLFPERSGMPDAKSDLTEGLSRIVDESTPLGPFGHIWPPPPIPVPTDLGKKGRRAKPEPEPTPVRSFITPLNLPPPPPTTQVKQPTPIIEDEVKDREKEKDKESGNSNQPSALRSMLTTMPARVTFMNEVQNFLSQPATKTRRNRAVIMTKALMKDALGVLLDPNTDELLKDYVPPEKKKDEEKSCKDKDRDGTPARGRKMSVAIDTTDRSSLEFRAWARRMFSTVKTSRGEDALAFDGKPVVVEDDIYETIVICHSQGNHCSTDETAKLVDQEHSWVPRALIEAFVQKCPGCPLENKVTSTTTKPKKRKSIRGSTGAGGPKRKPTTVRRGKKAQDGEGSRRSRKFTGKEASPEESDGEENDQEEDELKESGDEAGPSDVKTEFKSDQDPDPTGDDLDNDQDQQDQDEPDPDPDAEPEPDAEAIDELDDAEELEMESEDEHVSAPSSSRPKNA